MKIGKVKGLPVATSQQVRGEHHLNEGVEGAVPPAVQWGTDQAPAGIPTAKTLKNALKTTADLRGDLSTPESD